MATLTITQNVDGDFVVDGDGYDPGTPVYTEQGTYTPADGTGGRRFGHGLFAIADDNGHFSVVWSKLFVVGTRHAPGTFELTTVGNPATGEVTTKA